MSYRIDDRWLWLGAGLALIIAVKGISYAIHDTVRLTQVKPAGKDEDEELQRQPEDSIPLDVLRTLATSPNPNISKSAIELISARCVKTSSLVSSVQVDAASTDPGLRRKARTALHFLSSWTLGGDTSNPVPPGMRTGGSTGALNLSPSVTSLDNGFEFDAGDFLSDRPAAQHDSSLPSIAATGVPPGMDLPPNLITLENGLRFDVRGIQSNRPAEGRDSEMTHEAFWAMIGQHMDEHRPDVRRRRREAMVVNGGADAFGDGDVFRPGPM